MYTYVYTYVCECVCVYVTRHGCVMPKIPSVNLQHDVSVGFKISLCRSAAPEPPWRSQL